MKFVYVINSWQSHPRTEYGGLIVAVASDDQECFELLRNFNRFDVKKHDHEACMNEILKAKKFPAGFNVKSEIVDYLWT
jgi:hypothetical protein